MSYTRPCISCGRPTYYLYQRCGDCANTPPNLTTEGHRRLLAERLGSRHASG